MLNVGTSYTKYYTLRILPWTKGSVKYKTRNVRLLPINHKVTCNVKGKSILNPKY